jgi:hypothetical protein
MHAAIDRCILRGGPRRFGIAATAASRGSAGVSPIAFGEWMLEAERRAGGEALQNERGVSA